MPRLVVVSDDGKAAKGLVGVEQWVSRPGFRGVPIQDAVRPGTAQRRCWDDVG